MFDIGWSELLIIAVVAIIVIGPKDLPRMLRNLGRAMGAVRRTASEFKAQFEDAVRDSELEELQREFADVAAMNPAGAIENAIGASLEPVSPSEAKPRTARKTTAKTKSTSKRRRKTAAKPANKTARRRTSGSSAKKPKVQ